MWIDWFRSGWQTANYSCFYIYRFYFALVSVFLFPCVYIPLFSLPFQRFQTKTHMLRCFCPQKQEINQTLCMCNEANLRFFWATICVRLWVCVCVLFFKKRRAILLLSLALIISLCEIYPFCLYGGECVCVLSFHCEKPTSASFIFRIVSVLNFRFGGGEWGDWHSFFRFEERQSFVHYLG